MKITNKRQTRGVSRKANDSSTEEGKDKRQKQTIQISNKFEILGELPRGNKQKTLEEKGQNQQRHKNHKL